MSSLSSTRRPRHASIRAGWLPLLFLATPAAVAQIRTPIATEPLTTTQPGPAPYNAKAVATSPTSAIVSWDPVGGVRGYMVERARTDNPACCVARTGLLTTAGWNDAALEPGVEYSFAITAIYADGRVGATEVVVATPLPALPVVKLSRNVEMATADGVLRLTPCAQKTTGGPGPGTIGGSLGTPGGGLINFAGVAGVNYVVERAPYGTTSWVLVGSTCGGPSPVDPSGGVVYVRDMAGGVMMSSRYTYRVTAVGSKGEVGWNTYHWTAPCVGAPYLTATVSGSTVTLTWLANYINSCGYNSSLSAETYTVTSSFGYLKSKSQYGWSKEVIYGVPVGTHTFTITSGWRPDARSAPHSVTATVAY
jgi:hypothetical protein